MIKLTVHTAVTCTYGSRKPTHPVINNCICNGYCDVLFGLGILSPALVLYFSGELISDRFKFLSIGDSFKCELMSSVF